MLAGQQGQDTRTRDRSFQRGSSQTRSAGGEPGAQRVREADQRLCGQRATAGETLRAMSACRRVRVTIVSDDGLRRSSFHNPTLIGWHGFLIFDIAMSVRVARI